MLISIELAMWWYYCFWKPSSHTLGRWVYRDIHNNPLTYTGYIYNTICTNNFDGSANLVAMVIVIAVLMMQYTYLYSIRYWIDSQTISWQQRSTSSTGPGLELWLQLSGYSFNWTKEDYASELIHVTLYSWPSMYIFPYECMYVCMYCELLLLFMYICCTCVHFCGTCNGIIIIISFPLTIILNREIV